ncbi:MAG: hypothetical protein GX115_05660 [Ruminiclostridium sp.]|nr:hypothetical protein [Ruminiclostridium sp.]
MEFLQEMNKVLFSGWDNLLSVQKQPIPTIIGSLVILLIFVFLYLALFVYNRNRHRFNMILATLVTISGLILYTIGYMGDGNQGLAEVLPHAIFSVVRMFTASDDYSLFVLKTEVISKQWYLITFWVTHLLAVFVSFSVILEIFGKGLFQKLKLSLSCLYNRYHIIFGVTNQSLYYGESILKKSGQSNEPDSENNRRKSHRISRNNPCVIYFDSDVSKEYQDKIFDMGAILHTVPFMKDGVINHKAFRIFGLKKMNPKVVEKYLQQGKLQYWWIRFLYPYSKKYRFYTFINHDELSITIIQRLMEYLSRTCMIPVERLQIYMLSQNSRANEVLEKMRRDFKSYYHNRNILAKEPSKNQKNETIQTSKPTGLYQVQIIAESEMAASELFRRKPLYKMLGIQKGKQTIPFTIMIIGAGELGIAVLRKAVAQGQFVSEGLEGKSPFSAFVIDKNAALIQAQFDLNYPEVREKYNVKFIEDDALGEKTINTLKSLKDDLKYIVITLGQDELNTKVAVEIAAWYRRERIEPGAIAVHVRDEEQILEKCEKLDSKGTHLCSEQGIIRFGAFRNVFSINELFGERPKKRILSAVLLKHLYDITYDIETSSEEKAALFEEFRNANHDNFSALKVHHQSCLNEQMELIKKSFTEELNQKMNKQGLQVLYRNFYADRLFLQMSNIASAEAMEVYMNEDTDQDVMQVYYQNEHLRWNAFHRIHGWRKMNTEEYFQRKDQVIQELRSAHEEGKNDIHQLMRFKYDGVPLSGLKFHQDVKAKKHACIITWDELDTLNENELQTKWDVYNEIIKAAGDIFDKTNLSKAEDDSIQELIKFLTHIPYYQKYDRVFLDNRCEIMKYQNRLNDL